MNESYVCLNTETHCIIPPAGAGPGSKSLLSWLPGDRHSSAPPALCPPRQVCNRKLAQIKNANFEHSKLDHYWSLIRNCVHKGRKVDFCSEDEV